MKTALITGGSRGIGAACVRAFSKAGYRVAFLYHSSTEQAEALCKETSAIAVCCDIRRSSEVTRAVRQVTDALRHVDVLINNAGIAQQKLLTDITDEDWDNMLSTHLSGAFYTTRAVLDGMIWQKSGRIINISSIWGDVGASCEVHYSAAKAGLIGLSKALSKEVGPSGITVNCICPGCIQTDMMKCFTDDDIACLRDETPLGRLGTPEDVAHCALFLASEGASFITGQVIGVGGGFGQ